MSWWQRFLAAWRWAARLAGPFARTAGRFRRWRQDVRRRKQRRSLHARLLRAWVRVHELRSYVERDRRAEWRERDRLVRQVDELRARLAEFEGLLRAYLQGQALIEADRLASAAARAREAAASGFGGLEAQEMPPRNPHEPEAENPAHIPTAAR